MIQMHLRHAHIGKEKMKPAKTDGQTPAPRRFRKMTPEALAKRKRSTISNAASKTMGGLTSK